MSDSPQLEIRPVHITDLPDLYRICLETGDSGRNATGLYQDPDLLGHLYVAPYALLQPDCAFVLTQDHRPVGYIVGVPDTAAFGHLCEEKWFPPLRQKHPLPAADDTSKDATMARMIHQGHRREPNNADYPAHLHINILPTTQKGGWGKKLMRHLFDRLIELGVPGIYLGVAADNPNAIGFYKHIGFKELDSYPTSLILGFDLTQGSL